MNLLRVQMLTIVAQNGKSTNSASVKIKELKPMNPIRRGHRIESYGKCMLVINGTTHQCTLENLSICGALVQASEPFAEIHTGSHCGLYLCNDPRICCREYACRITHATTTKIGLSFL